LTTAPRCAHHCCLCLSEGATGAKGAMARAILLNAGDTVATALTPIAAGEIVEVELAEVCYRVAVRQDIPFAHKFALVPGRVGELVVKHGVPIGRITRPIEVGDHVHTHNLVTTRQAQET
jgi:hypothetical protein